MKLIYKYYGYEAGISALKYKTIGFNTPNQFNDPMEGRLWLHQMGVDADYLNIFLDQIGILCMTEDPLNPLMWSHYGQSHSGFVIGYDIQDPIFGPQRDCVFGINDGQVFYSPEFETDSPREDALKALRWLSMGMGEPSEQKTAEVLRHIFLMKQECWSYEKETRIVKLITNFNKNQHDWVKETGNNFQTISTRIAPRMSLQKSKLRLLNVAPGSVKRVILGMKNPLLQNNIEVYPDIELTKTAEEPGLAIDKAQWSVDGERVDAVRVTVSQWGHPKVIQTKKLEPSEVEAISKKLHTSGNDGQSLTLTTYRNGSIETFWDSEL